MRTKECPSSSELVALAVGRLAFDSVDRMASHVDTCLDCQSFLETVRSDRDPLIASLKRPAPIDAFTAEPEFQRGLSLLNAFVADRAFGSGGPTETEPANPVASQITPSLQQAETLPPSGAAEGHADKHSVPPNETFGRYRIIQTLGQGGMGTVYLAHDPQLDRRVALKIPHFSVGAGPEVFERFYRESRAAAKLDHPNICPVHDVGAIDGVPYLVMAYIDGQPLSEAVRNHSSLSPTEVVAIVRKLALALQEAHDHSIVHRDLKPSNIMVNRRGEPIVMDFGLAQICKVEKPGEERLTQSGVMIGTPAYMAPEQVMGDVQLMGPACDIYSLGVIMYELLTGRLPFTGPVASVLGQIMVSEPIPPTRLQPDVDPQLEAICLKAMAKSIDARFTSMAEMASALEEFARRSTLDRSVESSTARRTDSLTKVTERPRRFIHGWIAAAIAAACVGLLAAVIYRVMTDKGTLVVEIDDPEIEAKLLQSGLIVRNSKTNRTFTIDVKGSRREWSGTYMLIEEGGPASGGDDGTRLKVEPNVFTLTRGGTVTVRVTLEPPAAVSQDKSTSPVVGPQSIGKVSREREIAAWVLGVDGRLRVELSDGRIVAVDRPSDLPNESFRVHFCFLGFGSKYVPEDVKRLAGLSGLRAIQLERYAGFDDDIFVPFRGMERLEEFRLRGESQLTGTGLSHFDNCKNLRTLELDACQLTDAACETISKMPNLQQVQFGSPHVTERGIEQLSKLPKLQAIVLRGTRFSAESAALLKRVRHLRHLACDGTTDEVLRHLGEMSNLTELWLFRSNVTDEGMKAVANMRKLESLIVQEAPLRGNGLANLRNLPSLRFLDLTGSEIDDSAMPALGELSRLQSIALRETRIAGAGLSQLAKLVDLRDLDLSGTQVTDASIAELGKIPALKNLVIENTLVTPDGRKKLRQALPDCKIIPEPP